jgi:hypothetical protein
MGGGNGYNAPLNQGMHWGRASIAAMVSCLAAQLAWLLDMVGRSACLATRQGQPLSLLGFGITCVLWAQALRDQTIL